MNMAEHRISRISRNTNNCNISGIQRNVTRWMLLLVYDATIVGLTYTNRENVLICVEARNVSLADR